jgi:hypothetical protein
MVMQEIFSSTVLFITNYPLEPVLNMGCNKNRGVTRIEEIWRLKGKNKKGRMRESSVVFLSYKN